MQGGSKYKDNSQFPAGHESHILRPPGGRAKFPGGITASPAHCTPGTFSEMQIRTSEENRGTIGGSSKAFPRTPEKNWVSFCPLKLTVTSLEQRMMVTCLGDFILFLGKETIFSALGCYGPQFILSSLFTPDPLNTQVLMRLLNH